MTRQNRHKGLLALLPMATSYGLVTDLLQERYGETGVMNFGKTCYMKVANLLWTC